MSCSSRSTGGGPDPPGPPLHPVRPDYPLSGSGGEAASSSSCGPSAAAAARPGEDDEQEEADAPPPAAAGQAATEENGEQEEARPVRPARDPGTPSQAMVDEHNGAGHLPYRSWCPHCVAGRRDGAPHKRQDSDDLRPEVHLDYGYVRRQGETNTRTILILKERRSRAIQVLMVSNKGVESGVTADRVLRAVQRFGLGNELILKVDNENALKALRQMVLDRLPAGAVPQEPPPKESSSNG